MIRLFLLQCFKHQIHWILKIFIILTHFHGIQKFNQCRKVLFLHWCFIMNVANQRTVKKRFGFRPELVTGFPITLCIGNQCCHQLQNIFFRMDVRKRIVVHTFLEIDRVKYFYLVVILQQSISALDRNTSFRISDHIRAVHLEQVRF